MSRHVGERKGPTGYTRRGLEPGTFIDFACIGDIRRMASFLDAAASYRRGHRIHFPLERRVGVWSCLLYVLKSNNSRVARPEARQTVERRL